MNDKEKLEIDFKATIKKKVYCAPELVIFGGAEMIEGSSNLNTDGFNTGS